MTDQQPPLLEFPCDYPIKVLGAAHPELHAHVLNVMHIHAPGSDLNSATVRDSSKGSWQSITVVIRATGKPQLDALFADLKTSARVKMVI